jgi:hypothetical protein
LPETEQKLAGTNISFALQRLFFKADQNNETIGEVNHPKK